MIIFKYEITRSEVYRRVRPVSYTHLKLIEMPIESFKWEKNISGLQNINVPVIAIIENGVRCNAVSYTHLDVYKRQQKHLLRRLFMRLEMEICMQRKPQLH